MVDVLNRLDGAAGELDRRMVVVLGNHEFDDRRNPATLDARLAQSEFHWLGANVSFTPGPDGAPSVADPRLSSRVMLESGGLRIGIFGVTVPVIGIAYAEFSGPLAAAREQTAALRAEGAEVVIGLTHLPADDDRRLLGELGAAGPDLIVGGHEHERMAFQVNGRWAIKADADARTATVIRLTMEGGKLGVRHEFRELREESPPPDPELQTIVDGWRARHEREFCARKSEAPDCLEEVYGRSRTAIEAEETTIRGRETGFGDWIADRMVEGFSACGAQVAFINSGSLRLNQDLEAGTVLTRRQVEELFGYPSPLALVRLDGSTLQAVADHALRGWPGSGSWLQISGFAFRHDTAAKAARELTLIGADGAGRAVTPGEEILAVTSDFLINPDSGDQDGFLMLDPSRIVECPANGTELQALVVAALRRSEPAGIAPEREGRICQTASDRCLAKRR
jgi:2',3'-cyclic-nucleotide 2'-phosphodiesterase (5'-nucleotidase family)